MGQLEKPSPEKTDAESVLPLGREKQWIMRIIENLEAFGVIGDWNAEVQIHGQLAIASQGQG